MTMKVMDMSKENTFKSKDLYLCAFLKASGLDLTDTWREGNKVFFIFEDKRKAEELLKEFCSGGVVNISLFTKAIQDLKTLIYN